MKYVYKSIAFFFLFVGALFFFGQDIPEISIATTTAVSLQDSTFPLLYLQTGDYTINTLHGYSSEMYSGSIRESITPLDEKKTLIVKIKENESKIKRLDYELADIANNKIIESNTLTAFETQDDYRTATIKLTAGLDTSVEYGFSITLTTNVSKRIYFYTRIKYYNTDFYLAEKLKFITDFHDATFGENKDFDISPYLELNTNDDSTFANVDIHSNRNLIMWRKLNPSIISEVVPTIHEINIETTAVSLNYFIEADTDSARETYYVKEFYRVRYSGSRIYLLAYNRTMEAFFDPNLISLKKSEFKIGISNATDLSLTSSDSNKKVAFVRNGSLWYYDLKENLLTSVFSFEHNNSKDYLRDYYNQHDIKILRVKDDGNISFMLYGYMNCGDYEGRVGILLYDYDAKQNQIIERVYIPLETTYQKLKEDLGEFCYVNDKNIFYFSLNDIVYAYNMASRQYDILTEHATRDRFSMLKDAKCFIWSNMSENGQANSITILNLDTSEPLTVTCKPGQSIVVFGTIDSNIIYGFVRNKDIHESTTGEIIRPAYCLIISDCSGNILRKYKVKNCYVTSASVNENIIRLKRCEKNGDRFVPTSDDTIMNQKNNKVNSVNITTRITQKTLTEKYISLPAGYVMERMPDRTSTKCVMVTENTVLHLDENNSGSIKYYIYAYGGITQTTTSASRAIIQADQQMGVVMDSKYNIVWERGGRFLSKQLSGINYPEDSSTSIKACTQMLLQAAQVTTTTAELKGNSILSMLKNYLSRPVALTNCTVDEILYFISNEKPVIGMTDSSHAVLITEYTTSTVTWMDPELHRKRTMSIASAEKLFKKAGYKFVSYI